MIVKTPGPSCSHVHQASCVLLCRQVSMSLLPRINHCGWLQCAAPPLTACGWLNIATCLQHRLVPKFPDLHRKCRCDFKWTSNGLAPSNCLSGFLLQERLQLLPQLGLQTEVESLVSRLEVSKWMSSEPFNLTTVGSCSGR